MPLGWIYILSNPEMPGLVKIGQSASDPDLRAGSLHTTGVPTSFIVEYKGLFENYASLEKEAHHALADRRVSKSREFFRATPRIAVEAIWRISPEPAKYEVLGEACLLSADIIQRRNAEAAERNAKAATRNAEIAKREAKLRAAAAKKKGEVTRKIVVLPLQTNIPANAPFVDINIEEAWSLAERGCLNNLEEGYSKPPSCPRCQQKVSAPFFRRLRITCPSCNLDWVQPT